MEKMLNYINGELIAPVAGAYMDNYEPATGEVYNQCPDSDAQDVQRAYEAAAAAFPAWSNTPVQERNRFMQKIADLIEANLDVFAQAESKDQGKPVWLARNGEIPRAVQNMRFFGGAVEHFASESHSMGDHALNYTLRKPIGVVGCISPWNLPLYLFTWKIAPAIAAGNCVVAKPSEVTPYTAFLFSKLCIEAGLPAGVLNILHGLGGKVGAAIVEHPEIKGISFTGSTAVGKYIAATASPMFKKISLELGGKNPNLVFESASIEKAAKESVRAAFTNQGEICLCGSRIFIQRSVYDKFRDAFIAEAKKYTVGDPSLDTSRVGAIASKVHFDKVMSYIKLAQEEGGKIALGGKPVQVDGRCKNGWFIEPTIIEGLDAYCRTNQEEIFGPVVTLQAFETEAEGLQFANATPYGLASVIWTEDLTQAHRVASHIKAGIVWINCWLLRDLRTPFGGLGQSGVGREGGWEALRFFTEPRNVCIKL